LFEAFIDPDVTTNFWFTKSSGRLKVDHEIRWDWEMYGASTLVLVKAIEPNKRIVIEWDGYSGRTTVEWKFLRARMQRHMSSSQSLAGQVMETNSSSTLSSRLKGSPGTLAGLKAFLEHGVKLNLVADKNPDAHKDGWQQA
jgi:uncharacterized protein YndB with AHSA1/START domain